MEKSAGRGNKTSVSDAWNDPKKKKLSPILDRKKRKKKKEGKAVQCSKEKKASATGEEERKCSTNARRTLDLKSHRPLQERKGEGDLLTRARKGTGLLLHREKPLTVGSPTPKTKKRPILSRRKRPGA